MAEAAFRVSPHRPARGLFGLDDPQTADAWWTEAVHPALPTRLGSARTTATADPTVWLVVGRGAAVLLKRGSDIVRFEAARNDTDLQSLRDVEDFVFSDLPLTADASGPVRVVEGTLPEIEWEV